MLSQVKTNEIELNGVSSMSLGWVNPKLDKVEVSVDESRSNQ